MVSALCRALPARCARCQLERRLERGALALWHRDVQAALPKLASELDAAVRLKGASASAGSGSATGDVGGGNALDGGSDRDGGSTSSSSGSSSSSGGDSGSGSAAAVRRLLQVESALVAKTAAAAAACEDQGLQPAAAAWVQASSFAVYALLVRCRLALDPGSAKSARALAQCVSLLGQVSPGSEQHVQWAALAVAQASGLLEAAVAQLGSGRSASGQPSPPPPPPRRSAAAAAEASRAWFAAALARYGPLAPDVLSQLAEASAKAATADVALSLASGWTDSNGHGRPSRLLSHGASSGVDSTEMLWRDAGLLEECLPDVTASIATLFVGEAAAAERGGAVNTELPASPPPTPTPTSLGTQRGQQSRHSSGVVSSAAPDWMQQLREDDPLREMMLQLQSSQGDNSTRNEAAAADGAALQAVEDPPAAAANASNDSATTSSGAPTGVEAPLQPAAAAATGDDIASDDVDGLPMDLFPSLAAGGKKKKKIRRSTL